MTYFIADMHLFAKNHTRAGKNYGNGPFADESEMSDYFLEHWNKKVRNKDTVYMLGDVSQEWMHDELIALVSRLNGKKILVLGNHDNLADYRYRILFHDICHMKEIKQVVDEQTYTVVMCHYK